MHSSGLLCINDGQPTRRTSDRVIDLFVVTPKVVPEVIACETLNHESIRSGHIGVLLEVHQKQERAQVTAKKYIIDKTDWSIWRECTERRLKKME